MPGKVVPMVNFNPAAAADTQTTATVTEGAERLLKQIDAMLEDERYEKKAPFLESVRNWVSERGICTANQQESVDNVQRHVEDREPRFRR